MKILGLITEYNPFHNGHLYHLNKSKNITGATHTVAIMSGNFLQRGVPAITHKWNRAKMAVESGVDLVIELPTVYACSTAEIFAGGSINLLNDLGCIDCICFGSESGDLNLLVDIANVLSDSPKEFTQILKKHINLGVTFPVARSMAIIEYFNNVKKYNKTKLESMNDIIKNPNNILGIEYLKAIRKIKSSIIPYTILRKSAHYHSKNISNNASIASATAIREQILNNNSLLGIDEVIPETSLNILSHSINEGTCPIIDKDFEKAILSILRRSTPEEIKNIFDVVEGLENRILSCSTKTNSLPQLYDCIKSKRYTLTRIQRILIHALLNINKDNIINFNKNNGPQYARVLAFNNKGREILKILKSSSTIPIISNLKHYHPEDEIAKQMMEIDVRATNIYSLAFKNKEIPKGQLDYIVTPYYKK